jgi:hypothetical protein
LGALEYGDVEGEKTSIVGISRWFKAVSSVPVFHSLRES